ncbi:2,3-bisphosphoglycerate-independent phosphoglycerate mutase [Vreelandella jeotgali]|uniref:2,3-bisphosphoglycerate-independent phosphoglycerate mutase n=1 Tax=Vreelandella jeotgali TaxID=553386 RepID=UPI00034C024E|nr:2,3-bisphosphoglycerate-independent phosphoglycerate mutase [Halomonas jeotgali]
MSTATTPRPVALIILDGYGHNPDSQHNAVAGAHTPNMDRLWAERPRAFVHTDGHHVGLPDGQMGNSEVGHMNIGAGRIVSQDFTRITRAVDEGDLDLNTTLTTPIDDAVEQGRAVHLMGLLSPGGVHSHEDHIIALAELAARRGAQRIYVHAFLDGRDMPPQSAMDSLERTNARLAELAGADHGFIASIIGRFYAMDRDNRWERVARAYELLTEGKADFHAISAEAALRDAYERDETDEFVTATSMHVHEAPVVIEDGDAAIFANFRADRARELARVFTEPDFDGFERTSRPVLAGEGLVMMTQYAEDIPAPVAFPPDNLTDTLGEVVANRGLTQLRIAETEKYPHVTFFFSGGREEAFAGETRLLLPSPQDVRTYDEKPEMSAIDVTDRLVGAINDDSFDLIICNYANGDMVGHTGDYDAAVKAIETVDRCVGRVVEAIERAGGACLITADHGNAEQMVHPVTGAPQTAHTTFTVPLVYVGQRTVELQDGRLCDLAPTLLTMMHQPVPAAMTGNPLLQLG